VPALVAAGTDPTAEPIRRAVRWLIEHQNADGGWGEDLRSYDDRTWAGRGDSTASQTAWALLALLAAGSAVARPDTATVTEPDTATVAEPDTAEAAAVERGVAFLVGTQRADGTWDEDLFTGTGFPGDFYINYHLYRLVFPVSALGRYLRVAS
jgi:squalene-hopene/tetraprenyl-beta-curcumene cyclase